MNINDLNEKLASVGLSLLVVVVGGLSILVFFFTSMRPSLVMHEKWDWPGMICSNESFRYENPIINPADVARNLECQQYLDALADTASGISRLFIERADKEGRSCSAEEAAAVRHKLEEAYVIQRKFRAPHNKNYFSGHLAPVERRKDLPENDLFFDSNYYLSEFSGQKITLTRDGRRYYVDNKSRYGGDSYTPSNEVVDPVTLLGLEMHPDLMSKDISPRARIYFDFDSVAATVEWDGEVQATYNCFNSDS